MFLCSTWHVFSKICSGNPAINHFISPFTFHTVTQTSFKHTGWFFRLIKILHEERLENLCILLNDNDHITSTSVPALAIPTNEDALSVLCPQESSSSGDSLNNDNIYHWYQLHK